MPRKKQPPQPNPADTEAAFNAWLDGSRQYQADVDREIAAAPDPHKYLADLCAWNDAIEARAAAVH